MNEPTNIVTSDSEPAVGQSRLTALQRMRRWGAPALTAALFLAGVLALRHLLASISVDAVLAEFAAIPARSIAIAVMSTVFGYLALVGYDWSALRYIGKKVPLAIMTIGSFSAYALGNTIGLAVFSGGAVRYRFYRSLGLDAQDIAVVSTFCAVSFGLGVTVVGLVALAWHPDALASIATVADSTLRGASIAILAGLGAGVVWLSVTGGHFQVGRFRIGVPSVSIVASQVVFSVVDIVLAGSTLYFLLPADAAIGFPVFAAIFAVAVLAGVLSHVPGGVGVFEGVMMAALAPTVDPAAVAASLVAYRLVYYLLPFLAAILLLAGFEIAADRQGFQNRTAAAGRFVAGYGRFVRPVLPTALGALTFIAGSLLLANGLIPVPAAIMAEIRPVVPLALLELSNAAFGALGISLILLANGVRRRVTSAFWIVTTLFAISAVSLVLQRIDYDLAFACGLIAVVLPSFRREFYRSSKLSSRMFTPKWIALAVALVLSLAALILFAHKDVPYDNTLWWQFAFSADTPRALRAAGVSAFTAFFVMLFLGLRPARPNRFSADPALFDRVAPIVAEDGNPDANFVFTGDKDVIVSDGGDAFIMYRRQGRSFIALADPVGPESTWPELIDELIERADRDNCRPVFYQVSSDFLPVYLDAGFTLSKLGEEAIIDLQAFSVDGRARSRLRQAVSRGKRDGLDFSIVSPPHSDDLLQTLRQISDAWLADKKTREKAFSLGRFDLAWLNRFRLALVSQNGKVVAFANLMPGGRNQHATIDLMRHVETSSPVTMDFLFTRLMLELKGGGFRTFSLGMAPLSGLERAHQRRLWEHAGIALVRMGGSFYNFEGLRSYKEKFDPIWRPRYLASWGGLDPMLAMADINALVSGGLRGAVSR